MPISPAWSSRFSVEAIRTLPRLGPIEDITPEWAWGGSTGRGVKVAIIDSGVDASHPAVGSVQGYVALVDSGDGLQFEMGPHEDLYGHGTACAGILRAAAPDCEIFSIRVLGPRLTGQGPAFLAAIR